MDQIASNLPKVEKKLKMKRIAKIQEENFWKKNLNRKRELNEIFLFDENLIGNLQNFLKKISSLNLREIEKNMNKKSKEIAIQTENIFVKISEEKSEFKNFCYESEKIKLEKKFLIALNDVEASERLLKEFEKKLIKTEDSLKRILQENKDLKIENKNLKEENNKLSEKYHKLKEFSEKFEENFRIEKEYLINEETFIENPSAISNSQTQIIRIPILELLKNISLISHITKYLHNKDILNLKHSNSELFFSIERNPEINKQILKNSIKDKNLKIESLLNDSNTNFSNEYDMYTFCNKNNIDLESLFKKYSPINKNNKEILDKTRKEFANVIYKSIEFICNDVKELIKSNNISSFNKVNIKNEKNLFGSVGNILKNVVNNWVIPNENSNSNKSSSTKFQQDEYECDEISPVETFFLNFGLNNRDNNFYFHSPNELKNLIYSTFFKLSNPYSTNILNIYIDEISLMFSHLLFFSIDAVKELIELRLVMNHLYECLSHLHNEKREILKENNELNKNLNSIRYINIILDQDRDKIKKELKSLKEQLEIQIKREQDANSRREILSLKFHKISTEYNEMKYYYKKELSNLKSNLETIQGERNEAVKMLIKLKEFVKIDEN